MPELNWIGKHAVRAHHREVDFHVSKRLQLLKRFLREDGSIWVSMDDSEIHLLRSLRHCFPMIGNLKPDGEKFECAQFLANECAAVETWVRNVDKKPGAFSPRTRKDRFDPDFLAWRTDGACSPWNTKAAI